MEFTRRDFVRLSGLTAITALGLSGTALAGNGNDLLSEHDAKSFRRLIGTDFYIWRDNFSGSAKLVKVQDFPYRTSNGECFALIFAAPGDQVEQATYNVFHPTIGNFELFLTEGKIGRRCALIATINRI